MSDAEQLFAELSGFATPPVADWHPRQSLDIGLSVAADGRWHYRGSPIERRRMVKLFGSVLRVDDGEHFLVTPQVKYPVAVADAPFVAVELRRQGSGRAQELFFRTNVDDVVRADREHPITVTVAGGQPSPRVEVRDGLHAKISRPVYYELAELVQPADDDENMLGVHSAGEFFPFGRSR